MSVFIESHNVISALGFSSQENFQNICDGNSGLKYYESSKYSSTPIVSSQIERALIENEFSKIGTNSLYTQFEKLSILSLYKSLQNSTVNPADEKTVLILSTTKGNIDILEKKQLHKKERLYLWHTAQVIADFFEMTTKPMVVSNACISGLSAMILADRLISSGQYENALIVGADLVSKFVVSGFQSFQSLSLEICKPFDANRDGLNIGEAVASVIVTKERKESKFEIVRGAIHNDSNHISGPSRTGEGLFLAIGNTIVDEEIDYISAHGTATPYNDNMEAVAISRAILNDVPLNSFKGFFGHTLGAAGVLETVMLLESMQNNKIVKTFGYNEFGVSEQVNVAKENIDKEIKYALKLASGFGGCNAALLIKKL